MAVDSSSEGVGNLPGFGTVLIRSRLLAILSERTEPVVLLSAPGGYGKSVIAAQLASLPVYDRCLWIDASELNSDVQSLESALDALLDGSSSSRQTVEAESSCDVVHGPECVVLDNLRSPSPWDVGMFAEELRAVSNVSSLVVVTTRDDVSAFEDGRIFVVPSSSLRLDDSEANALVRMYSDTEWSDGDCRKLTQASGGLPAVLSVLSRQATLTSLDEALSVAGSRDVLEHLRMLAAEQLTEEEARVLRAMAVLGHGTIKNVCYVLETGECDAQVERVADVIPLVRVDTQHRSFKVHDLATSACAVPGDGVGAEDDFAKIVERACCALDKAGQYDLLLRLATAHSSPERLAMWTQLHGNQLLFTGSVRALRDAIDAIGLPVMLDSPRLLLLQAELLRQTADYGEALRKAGVARDLAYHEDDQLALFDALLMLGRMHVDLGSMSDAALALEEALDCSPRGLAPESTALAEALFALSLAFVGRLKEAEGHAERAQALAAQGRFSADVMVRITMSIAATAGVFKGRWDVVLRMCLQLRKACGISLLQRLHCEGNLGAVLAELGRLGRSATLLTEVMSECRERGLHTLELSYTDSLAVVEAGLGQYALADELASNALRRFEEIGDSVEAAIILVYRSTWTRFSSNPSKSLELAEAALEYPSAMHRNWLYWSAALEVAASLLALGDVRAAVQRATSLRSECQAAGAERHWVTADMILAEASRRENHVDEGIARLVEHEEYVLTESANWQIAMYVRAFPHLLGMFAAALGPEALPAHLLRMVLPDDMSRTLAATSEVVDEDIWHRLAARLMGEPEATSLIRRLETPDCEVGMFGGLSVRIGNRNVVDRDWRKRKARLLFAMLVLNRGREMPREQVLDYLWPEMDQERARNNFYVIWSAMKGALSPGSDKSTPSPYIENSGGMCCVVPGIVKSDVERFGQLVAESLTAEKAGDPALAIAALEQLTEVYRGELLPGDIYDDWFCQARDSFRVEFGDAMLRAAGLLEAAGEPARALSMIRRALAEDAWREDLYQAALALQIACGQRSAAIETYTLCRRKLADDLGLDPSSETMRLYERILSMEEEPEPDR